MRSWVTYLGDDLMVKVDRVLMGFSLEGRVPFLDQRVVEFGLALPDSLKVDGRHGKLMLRRWAERRLPREHVWRRKASLVSRRLSQPAGRAPAVEPCHPALVSSRWCRCAGA